MLNKCLCVQGFETVAEVDINQEKFVASGLQIVARNYLEVYPYDKWSDKSIPRFAQGDTFQVCSKTVCIQHPMFN